MPELSCILLAGPNGSGKSSAFADEIAKAMPASDDGKSTDIQAGRAVTQPYSEDLRKRAMARRTSGPSPDLNPIEQVFAKLKHLIRNAEPRSVETTWRTAGHMLDAFPRDECANYLRKSGYAAV